MRKVLVAGNWKLNGSVVKTETLIKGILEGAGKVNEAQLAVCPPFPYLGLVNSLLNDSKIALGAQDLSDQTQGAYTGEVSGEMLKEFGCGYALVGHSERRALYAEDDAFVARKFQAAQNAGLIPILCIGETLEERETNITEDVVSRQLNAVIELCGVEALQNSVIAYEPVWAIGTGKTASPEQAQAVHAFIRGSISKLNQTVADSVQILYGGSVKPDNAAELFAKPDIDGGLIGGASLKPEDFLGIGIAANNL